MDDKEIEAQYRRVLKTKLVILQHPRTALFSRFVFVGDTKMDVDCPTAKTDGFNEWYGPKFVASLNDKQLLAVIMHETLHKMFDHIGVWEYLFRKDPKLTNMAADYVVNNIINEYVEGELKDFIEFWTIPKPLLDKKYDSSWSVKTVFEDLQKKQKQKPSACQGQAMDDHATGKNSDDTPESKAARQQALNNAMAEGIKAQKKVGKIQGWMESFITELQQPKINWRSKVVEFLTNKQAGDDRSDWKKPRGSWLANGFYRPRRYDETLNRVACGIDVSGSIYSAPAMSLFLSEFMGLTKEVGYNEINMLYWDTHITKEETYDTANPFTLAKTKPSGGGGTDPECIRAHLGKHNTPDFLLMFTDGEVPNWGNGKWPCPVLWVVVDNPAATPTCGNVIHIKL